MASKALRESGIQDLNSSTFRGISATVGSLRCCNRWIRRRNIPSGLSTNRKLARNGASVSTPPIRAASNSLEGKSTRRTSERPREGEGRPGRIRPERPIALAFSNQVRVSAGTGARCPNASCFPEHSIRSDRCGDRAGFQFEKWIIQRHVAIRRYALYVDLRSWKATGRQGRRKL